MTFPAATTSMPRKLWLALCFWKCHRLLNTTDPIDAHVCMTSRVSISFTAAMKQLLNCSKCICWYVSLSAGYAYMNGDVSSGKDSTPPSSTPPATTSSSKAFPSTPDSSLASSSPLTPADYSNLNGGVEGQILYSPDPSNASTAGRLLGNKFGGVCNAVGGGGGRVLVGYPRGRASCQVFGLQWSLHFKTKCSARNCLLKVEGCLKVEGYLYEIEKRCHWGVV